MPPRAFLTAFLAVLALLGASCGDVPGEAAAAKAIAAAPMSSPAPRAFLEFGSGESTSTSGEPTPGVVPAPRSLERWEWAVRSGNGRLTVWTDPRDRPTFRMNVDATNPWDQPIAFPVREVHVADGTAWYRVLLGIEPNGSIGWVRGDDVTFDRIRDQVVIDLSERTLRHYRDGELRHRFSVGIGSPETPTTVGRFFVWAHLKPRDPSGQYGSYLLGLSGFSEVLEDWPGGGRIAIHGTADPTDPGNRVSYGCARVYNPQMNELRDIPMGATVLIHS